MSYEWWSILPPIVAIGLAIVTRRIVPSLLVSVFAGALIWKQGRFVDATIAFAEDLLWSNLVDEDHLRVFAFTLLMGGMIGVIHASGGMQDLVNRIAPLARGRCGGQLITWLLGLIIFIDDYANTLLLGTTMRPLTDRLRISREKLAYLVDSTAAPVSGLALVSTWVAGEIGYIEQGFSQIDSAGPAIDGFAVFVETIPYRFYVLYALVLVPMIAIFRREIGPMWRAESRASNTDSAASAEVHSTSDGENNHSTDRGHWLDAVAPVLVTIGVTIALLYATGRSGAGESADTSRLRWLIAVIGGGDSYLSLVYGSLAGLLMACAMTVARRTVTMDMLPREIESGGRQVVPALLILWLAWSLSNLTDNDHLMTGQFLGGLLSDAFDARWMPTVVFVLSSIVAFSTGTSWGTMGVLMPLMVPVTFQMMAAKDPVTAAESPLMIATVGSVLAGAIFGDHCSPISDTTVLSSQASGCNHLEHVWTQLPYALVAAAVAIFCGTLPAGFGMSPWILLPIGSVALAAIVLVFGRRIPDE